MKLISGIISGNKFLAQLIFLVMPTLFATMFLLWTANQYYPILREQWLMQSFYFAFGVLIASFFYQIRFRFITTYLVLLFLFFLTYQFLDNFSSNEFDAFFISKQFLVFSFLFSFGWFSGWGLSRIRLYPIILAFLYLFFAISLWSKFPDLNFEKLISILLPFILYAIYLIYTSEALYNISKTEDPNWKKFSLRLIAFLFFGFVLATTVFYFMYDEINEKLELYGGRGKKGDESMLENDKNGDLKSKNSMGMGSQNSRNKELLFCAYIDNFFPETNTPNPLYLSAFSYTKFDTLTETFERDAQMPYNDEFTPDVSKIDLFFSKKDSSKLENALYSKNRKKVDIEIYKKKIPNDFFIAPSNSYFVQPISVEKEYQAEFKYAYRASSYVSELNSAYFIYNSPDPQIQFFQEQRFALLRAANNYENTPNEFIDYYTNFPNQLKYKLIKKLADSLSKNKLATIDKVIAVRDYFLQKNELGEQVYKYSDNPGVPGVPDASKLINFLFESKNGYCAYYAGATLFLLRAMNVPTRIMAGFLTIDRSDNNKGWYWYYADQAHAWVQVYFPEYGWIDFDTTVGNEEAEQSPKPDGTPPLRPPKAILVIAGKVQRIDSVNKKIALLAENVFYKNAEYKNVLKPLEIGTNKCFIWKDSNKISINSLKKGQELMAISYNQEFETNNTVQTNNQNIISLPSPFFPDDIYIKSTENKKNPPETVSNISLKVSIINFLKLILGLILFSFIILISLPLITLQFYKIAKNKTKWTLKKAYYTYQYTRLKLALLNFEQVNETILSFAKDKIDTTLNLNYSKFITIYLKSKYAPEQLNEDENNFIQAYLKSFNQTLKQQIKSKENILSFLNLSSYFKFFIPN
ncbi:MAG: transglutaminase domain-containing protein [Chitinophagaceae bacterium]|nr:transglutaminase domain-containing protein [Chitinophagaceae bacterium]